MGTRAPVHQVLLRACVCGASSMCIYWQRAHTAAIITHTSFRSKNKHCAHARKHAQASRLTHDDNSDFPHTHAEYCKSNVSQRVKDELASRPSDATQLTPDEVYNFLFFVFGCVSIRTNILLGHDATSKLYLCMFKCMYVYMYIYIYTRICIYMDINKHVVCMC